MKRIKIKVPEGTKYVLDWKDYTLPKGQCVVDKGVTGCGYTEFCLRNGDNVILCSPRKMMLTNKAKQHKKDCNIFYFENNFDDLEDVMESYQVLQEHVLKCMFEGLPVKIMVTYDSFHYVLGFLKKRNQLDNYMIVVDEMQSLFSDVFLKADVENNFLISLQDCPNVLFLSATPMMEKYLDRVDEFKNLPMYQLDWSETGVVEPLNIQRSLVESLTVSAKRIISDFREGKYPILVVGGNIHRSNEAVFFINSVNDIVKIIKSAELKPSEVNILCSDTATNRSKLKKVGHVIGEIPLEGETNKMFTFCTSTCYIGADFYSPCASTYIFSDPNINSLAVDISIDFPQIVGRQRNKNNYFKNYVTIFYRVLRKSKFLDKDEFQEAQRKRKQNTEDLLVIWGKTSIGNEREILLRKFRDSIEYSAYETDYISIKSGTIPVYNPLIELANERAWEVAQEDYQDSISVTKRLDEISNGTSTKAIIGEEERLANDFLQYEFFSTGVFPQKMRAFCEFMDTNKEKSHAIEIILRKTEPKFNNFYSLIGTSGCKALKFRESALENRLNLVASSDRLRREVMKSFEIGERYTRKFIKGKLSKIYESLNIKTKSPKANDIEEWFNARPVKIQEGDGRENGFEILGIK
jgi:hypothetical protein